MQRTKQMTVEYNVLKAFIRPFAWNPKASTTEPRTATCHSESGKGQCRVIFHRDVCNGLCRSTQPFETASLFLPDVALSQQSVITGSKHLTPGMPSHEQLDLRASGFSLIMLLTRQQP